jgi:hypothetical protein
LPDVDFSHHGVELTPVVRQTPLVPAVTRATDACHE